MKKLLILLIIFVTACNNANEIGDYDGNRYRVFHPYKEGHNYSLNTLNNLNMEEVETYLMDISKEYFNPKTNYYQNGQYLKESDIKDILNEINSFEEIEVDGIKISPKYLTTIHEQNYLDSNGKLTGVSLGLVINRFQQYTNSYGATLYKELEYEEVLKIAEELTSLVLQSYRSKYDLPKTRILVGLFFQTSVKDTRPGVYTKFGITTTNTIKFKELNYSYHDLDSDYASVNDMTNYNAYSNLLENFKDLNMYVNAYAIYKDNNPVNIIINFNSVNTNENLRLYINQRINNYLINSFKYQDDIKIYIRSNNEIKSVLIKNKNQIEGNIYLLD